MKKKTYKIFGVGLVVMLVVSLLAFVAPVAAEEFEPAPANQWNGYGGPTDRPIQGRLGGWFYDPSITAVGPIAEAINGNLYAYVQRWSGSAYIHDIYKSTNGGRSWSTSIAPNAYPSVDTDPATAGVQAPGQVVDMVCSSLYEDVLYVTDGNYVYKSVDGSSNFAIIARENLEYNLMGDCNVPVTDEPITCIDVGYNGSDEPIVFIGTRCVGHTYVAGHPLEGDDVVGTVLWIAEETFPAEWHDLQLFCYGCCDPTDQDTLRDGCFDVYAVGCDPSFADTNKTYALVTRPTTLFIPANTAETFTVTADATLGATFSYSTPAADLGWAGTCGASPVTLAAGASCTFTTDGTNLASEVELYVTAGRLDSVVAAGASTVCPASTQVVSTVGTTCSWAFVSELFWDCVGHPGTFPATWGNNFQIRHASRFAFPDDFADTHAMFIGVTGVYYSGPGGDVYRVVDTIPPAAVAIDLNVQGFTTGCIGLRHANICSLDMYGSTDDGSLIAGAYDDFETQDPTNAYYSSDGGWTWSPSKKDPTGQDRTYVLWYGDTAVSGTRWCDCAFSMSCGDEVGEYWNQISLINTCILYDLDLSHAPGYLDGASTMYLLTYCDDSCWRSDMESTSLFRWDGTYWERVYSSFTYANPAGDALMDWVEVSPDFNTTNCLYLASTDFQMYRSIDAGCSWSALSYPCEPRPRVDAWIVVDEETVLVAGYGSSTNIYKTTRHGTRPWDSFPIKDSCSCQSPLDENYWGVDFDLSPNIASDGSVLFGDCCGRVFISEDVGSTWDEIKDAVAPIFVQVANEYLNTYVQFDPGYGTSGDRGENMIYAAAGTIIGRCNIDPDALWKLQNWEAIKTDLCQASGIDAYGDTALYVSDGGVAAADGEDEHIEGTLAVRYDCGSYAMCSCDLTIDDSAYFQLTSGKPCNEPLEIVAANLYCTTKPGVSGTIVVKGITSGEMIRITIDDIPLGACWMCEPPGSAVEAISGDITLVCPTVAESCPTGVWRTLNPMDPIPPVAPVNLVEFELLNDGLLSNTALFHDYYTWWTDDLWLTRRAPSSNVLWCLDYNNPSYVWVWDDPLANPVILASPTCGAQLASTGSVTLEWEALDGATLYEVELYQYCPQCPEEKLKIKDPVTGKNYTSADTCLIVSGLASGTKHYWRVRVASYSPYLSKWSELCDFTTALGPIPNLCSPVCGGKDIILTTNFSWDEVAGAASYELQIVAAGADGTADFTGATTLTTDVNALASIPGLEYSTTYYWRVRAITAGVPGAWAVCIFTTMDEPVEPVPPADLVVNIPAEEVITPAWIWVIIGIGAALTIAVVILIVTTRRVP